MTRRLGSNWHLHVDQSGKQGCGSRMMHDADGTTRGSGVRWNLPGRTTFSVCCGGRGK